VARRRPELEPIDAIDVLRAARALRLGANVVETGVPRRHDSLATFVAVHREELEVFAAGDRPVWRSARRLLDAFGSEGAA
jgi:hypothetical protein